jgi:hypothetical protein
VHDPFGKQHATGCGQALGVQLAPAACTTPAPMHVEASPNVHVPSGKQHATGCGHGFGVQLVPAACTTPAPVHVDASPNVHVPSGKQHATGWGHGFGEQTPSRVHTLGGEHAPEATTEQLPDGSQQLPPGIRIENAGSPPLSICQESTPWLLLIPRNPRRPESPGPVPVSVGVSVIVRIVDTSATLYTAVKTGTHVFRP